MYTRMVLDVQLKPDTPAEVIEAIRACLGEVEPDVVKLADPLFECYGRHHMLRHGSTYFETIGNSALNAGRLTVDTNLKNYDSEFICPYVLDTGPQAKGYSQYEDRWPRPVFFPGPDGIVLDEGEKEAEEKMSEFWNKRTPNPTKLCKQLTTDQPSESKITPPGLET